MPYRLPNTLPYSNLGSNKKRFKKWQKRGVLLWGRSSVWLERLPVTAFTHSKNTSVKSIEIAIFLLGTYQVT